jgi:acyl-CoA synthetase (AMP-forming)/AMP-acid ligase II
MAGSDSAQSTQRTLVVREKSKLREVLRRVDLVHQQQKTSMMLENSRTKARIRGTLGSRDAHAGKSSTRASIWNIGQRSCEAAIRDFETYQIPLYVDIVDEYPMTVTGKIRKIEMRERAVRVLGLDAREQPPSGT